MTDTRRILLAAALDFAQLCGRTAEIDTLRAWLDSWPGIRCTALAMRVERQCSGPRGAP
jgi:hypothetical protein